MTGRPRHRAAAWLAVALACACTSSVDPSPDAPRACVAGEVAHGGGCCVAGTLPVDGGGCAPAGVPPDRCGEGFSADERGGCIATLPPESCPPGLWAVPGMAACAPLMECGADRWGSIPRDATTQHVDASYAAGDGDGSAERPWPTVQAAVDAAAEGAVVAIAAGRYVENVLILGRSVRLWGRCPQMVELVGAPAMIGTVFVESNVGTELHGVAITGGDGEAGVVVSGARDLLLHGVWLHDLPGRALNVQSELGETSVRVEGSLIESVPMGMFLAGATVAVHTTAIRDAHEGVAVRTYLGTPAHVTVEGTLFERNRLTALRVSSSAVEVHRTVFRDTLGVVGGPKGSEAGQGIVAFEESAGGGPTTLAVTSSVFERSVGQAVFLGGVAATLEAVTIRDTRPLPGRLGAAALFATREHLSGQASAGAHLRLRASLVERSMGIGVGAAVDADLEGVLVRDTLAEAGSSNGAVGMVLGILPGLTITVAGSEVVGSEGLGLLLDGTAATVRGTRVAGTLPGPTLRGEGVVVQQGFASGVRAAGELEGVVVEDSHRVGVVVLSSDALLRRTVIRRTLPGAASGKYGDGISVQTRAAPATLEVTDCTIEASGRAALSSFGAAVRLGGSTLSCNTIDLNGESQYDAYTSAYTFDDVGGNVCGCAGEEVACGVASSALEAPEPPEPPLLPSL